MKQVHIEHWKSSKGNREDHYFSGPKKVYLFGYNPELVSKEQINKIMKILNVKVEKK